MKTLVRACLSGFLLALAACSLAPSVTPTLQTETSTSRPPTQPAPTLIPTVTLAPILASPTPFPTQPPKPTSTPAPVPTPTPAAIPLQDVSWSDHSYPIIVSSSSVLQWSPAFDELIFPVCTSGILSLIRTSAPDFNPVILESQAGCQEIVWKQANPPLATAGGALWMPDGKSVLYFQSPEELWSINRDGSQPGLFLRLGSVLFPSLEGWLDNRNVIYSAYGGSGHSDISFYDFISGANRMVASVPGVLAASNGSFVSVSYHTDPKLYGLLIISDRLDNAVEPAPGILARGRYETVPILAGVPVTQTITGFNDWLPGTNQALVSWTSLSSLVDPVIGKQLLMLWDVKQNTANVIVPNGFQGAVSIDGRYLAFLSKGRARWDNNHQLLDYENGYHPSLYGAPDAVVSRIPTFMQLLDFSSQQVMLSVQSPQVDFSPDGRYLSFITNGQLEVDSTGWPTGATTGNRQVNYLNLLDLVSQHLVLSLSDISTLPSWAPDTSRFLCQDSDNNLFLFDMSTAMSTPVTLSLGSYKVNRIDWSISGNYFSIQFTDTQGAGSQFFAVVAAP